MDRRRFLGALAASAGAALLPAALTGQEGQPVRAAPNPTMDETRYRKVALPSRGTGPSMTNTQLNDLERQFRCQCGCTEDVFTCRSQGDCGVSPRIHGDLTALVEGGYSASEIIDAFTKVYGERVLTSPVLTGFNWAGYIVPFAALGGGAAAVVAALRRWNRAAPEQLSAAAPPPLDATPDEMARLEAAVRGEGR